MWHAYLIQCGLADGVIHYAKPLLVSLQLPEHSGPGDTSTGQLECHSTLWGGGGALNGVMYTSAATKLREGVELGHLLGVLLVE